MIYYIQIEEEQSFLVYTSFWYFIVVCKNNHPTGKYVTDSMITSLDDTIWQHLPALKALAVTGAMNVSTSI